MGKAGIVEIEKELKRKKENCVWVCKARQAVTIGLVNQRQNRIKDSCN
jgi:hypothetical protein